jgi:hypothetical protein
VLYMLEIFLLVSIPIFALAGTVLLTMIAWTKARHYVRTRISSQPRPAAFVRAA